MLTELCKGDLYDLIASSGPILDRSLVRSLFRQICLALDATKQAGYAHLDIKLENILIGSDYNLRLCDFGFAIKLGVPLTGMRGSDRYIAPEIIDEKTYSYDAANADIFSLGVVLFTMYFGQPPFNIACSKRDLYFKRMVEEPTKFFRLHPSTRSFYKKGMIEEDVQDLILKMLSPSKRPTIENVLQHPFLKGESVYSIDQS
jgi:serine/threonine protein kinase